MTIDTPSIKKALFRGGMVALFNKVGAAALQFLMFLALARAMSTPEYGLFGFAFSLATLLAVGGSFGQRMLSLRFLGIYASDRMPKLATGIIRDGLRIVVLGTAALSILTALILPLLRQDLHFSFILLAGIFALVMALAEYFSYVLRSYGGIMLSLAPRDIIWRALVVLFTLPFALGWFPQIDASSGISLITVLLALIIVCQTLLHPATRPHALFCAPADFQREQWKRAAWGLWGTSFVQVAAPNLTIVIIGLLLSPQQTGPVFAALRIAQLLNLFLLAANMAASPLISRLFHEKRFAVLQRTCSSIALLSSVTAGLSFLLILLEGRFLLDLFGANYSVAYPALVIVSGAYMINTLTGPTSALLELTGHERAAFRMITTSNIVSLAAMPFATSSFGAVGATACLAFSIIGWNLQAVSYARRKIGIDPSILGIFYKGQSK